MAAEDLTGLKIIDEVVKEPLGGAHRDFPSVAAGLKTAILKHLKELKSFKTPMLLDKRYQKFRKMGAWIDTEKTEKAAPKTKVKAKV